MMRKLHVAVLVTASIGLAFHAPFTALLETASGLAEPIAVDGGQVTGTPTIQWSYGVRLFRGIPYAAPPIGDLRWRPPQPIVPWQGVRAADHFSPSCMQAPTSTEGNAWREGHVPVSEDCLYLNIWTPARSAGDKLPVMVFIHGGGNTRGAASENQYDGAYLAKKGVVFVSFNYRMNVFGFMAHPELTRESSHHASGNYALLDQIAALQWIQRNIAKFGGDAGSVTIFGHSAGASDVVSLMASPVAKALFHRAMALSGTSLAVRTPLAEAEKAGVKFATDLGAPSLAALRQKPAREVLNAPRPQMVCTSAGTTVGAASRMISALSTWPLKMLGISSRRYCVTARPWMSTITPSTAYATMNAAPTIARRIEDLYGTVPRLCIASSVRTSANTSTAADCGAPHL